MSRLVSHPWISLGSRLILGALFIYASLDKIAHPDLFAQVVHNYRILPLQVENIFALALPWVELGAGAFLIAGLLSRSSALVLTALLAIFVLAISVNLWRGVDMTCGCFKLSNEGRHLGWLTLLEDLALFLPALQLLAWPRSTLSLDTRFGSR